MLHTKFLEWWPSWSCDPDAANKLYFPLPINITQNLALIGKAVSEMFEIVDDGRADNGRTGAGSWL